MARIVIGAGTSHGPGIQRPVELWAELGVRDRRDPRFDYNELLKTAPPGLDAQISPSVQRRRQDVIRAALMALSDRVAAAQPDLAIIVSNAHVVDRENARPVFSIVRSETLPFVPSTGVTFEQMEHGEARQEIAGHPALANHLIDFLNRSGFDVGCRDGFGEAALLDEAFAFCYRWIFGGTPIPTVPLFLSRDLPGQPYPGRCIDLGRALREALQAFPGELRIALICSGGLSHQVVDEELDRSVIASLSAGTLDDLRQIDRIRLNKAPGTPEILNWITVGAAMAPGRMELLAYEPCYRSIAGTGFGGAVGAWPTT